MCLQSLRMLNIQLHVNITPHMLDQPLITIHLIVYSLKTCVYLRKPEIFIINDSIILHSSSDY